MRPLVYVCENVSALLCVCVSMNWQTSLENKHTHKLSTQYWALILPYYLYYLVLETSFSVFLSLTLSLSLLVFYCRAQREIQLMFVRYTIEISYALHIHNIRIFFTHSSLAPSTPSSSLVSVFLYALLLGWIICTQRTRFGFFFKSAKKNTTKVFQIESQKNRWQWTIYRIICLHT